MNCRLPAMEMMMKKVLLIAGLLATALTAGCADSQRWQSQEYQPNMTGDIWAPRPDWKLAEDQAKTDWQDAQKKMAEPSCLFPCVRGLTDGSVAPAKTPAKVDK